MQAGEWDRGVLRTTPEGYPSVRDSVPRWEWSRRMPFPSRSEERKPRRPSVTCCVKLFQRRLVLLTVYESPDISFLRPHTTEESSTDRLLFSQKKTNKKPQTNKQKRQKTKKIILLLNMSTPLHFYSNVISTVIERWLTRTMSNVHSPLGTTTSDQRHPILQGPGREEGVKDVRSSYAGGTSET